MSTEPTTDIYDSWNVEVPALIRGLLLKNKVFSPEDLAGATIGQTSEKKFNQLQQLKKDLGIELLEPFNYQTWPVDVPGLLHTTLKNHAVGVPHELELADIRLTFGSKKSELLRELRLSLGFSPQVESSLKFDIPDSLLDVGWKEVGLKVGVRTRRGLKRYGLDTIRKIAQFLSAGSLNCPTTGETLGALQLTNFGEASFAQLEQEVDDLCRVGLDAYRDDGWNLEGVNTASELLAVIGNQLDDRAADVFFSEMTLQQLGDKYGVTKARAGGIRREVLDCLPGSVQSKAVSILTNCWDGMPNRVASPIENAISITGATNEHEVQLLCNISKANFHLDTEARLLWKLPKQHFLECQKHCTDLIQSNEISFDEKALLPVSLGADQQLFIHRKDFLLLAGHERLARKFRSQLSTSKSTSNGVEFGTLRPTGIFSTAKEAFDFINENTTDTVELLSSGAIRIEGAGNNILTTSLTFWNALTSRSRTQR